MKTYRVLLVKHRYFGFDFADACEVDAEGPCQAVEKWAKTFHGDRGHCYESNTVRVLCPDGEQLVFDYEFYTAPRVCVRWDRSAE